MTSCLFVKAPDRLVAVADGRLSIDESTVSFDSTLKIQRVTPKYRIPIVSLGRFDHYRDWIAEDCFVAYAGTYALASEVIQEFSRRVSGRHILVWRQGRSELSDRFDENAQFLDDYLFRESDLAEFGAREILEQFRAALQTKGDEWCANRKVRADVEFLLFGKGTGRRYWAFKINVDAGWSIGAPILTCYEPLRDGVLASIGSPSVSAAAFDDVELQRGLSAWSEDQTAISLGKSMDALRRSAKDFAPSRDASDIAEDANWSSERISHRFAQLLRDGSDATVGGDLTVAMGGWHGEIAVRRQA